MSELKKKIEKIRKDFDITKTTQKVVDFYFSKSVREAFKKRLNKIRNAFQ